MNWYLLFLGAGIGWVTNHIALKMLFSPKKPVGIGSIKIQGLIPKREQEFIDRCSDGIVQAFPWYLSLPVVREKVLEDTKKRLNTEFFKTFIYQIGKREVRLIEALGALIGLIVGLIASFIGG